MRHILIDKNSVDLKCCSFGFPWARDSNCYNFRVPTELVLAADVNVIHNLLEIETIVIGCILIVKIIIQHIVMILYTCKM